ncbi:hypothetical protein AK812_SmicGene48665, partial [Symbiodinium microadriaticum]
APADADLGGPRMNRFSVHLPGLAQRELRTDTSTV